MKFLLFKLKIFRLKMRFPVFFSGREGQVGFEGTKKHRALWMGPVFVRMST